MPWQSVDELKASDTFKRTSEMHSWPVSKLRKFMSAFSEVFTRVMRNGGDQAKAERAAFPIAFEVSKRAASDETMSRLEPTVHYFASMVPHMSHRDGADEIKFGIVQRHPDFIKALSVGSAFTWDHVGDDQIGAVRDVILRSEAPAEVQAATDPAVPFFFVASYRNDIPAESRNEVGISAEWLTLRDGEVVPFTFAASHEPYNGPETGVKRVASNESKLDTETNDILGSPKPAAAASKGEETPAAGASAKAPDETLADPKQGAKEASVESAKSYQDKQGSTQTGEHPMHDPPESKDPLEVRLASLQKDLETTRKERDDARLNFAAVEDEKKELVVVVDQLKQAAKLKKAEDAALTLVRDGKIAASQTAYYRDLFVDMGEEKFAHMASQMRQNSVGVAAVKAAFRATLSDDEVKAQRDIYSRLLTEN